MPDTIICDLSVCVDCMLDHANGEVSPDRPSDLPPVWGAIEPGYSVTMGGEHNEECANFPEWQGEECDCEDLGFRTSACEGCGDFHHGDRFLFTLWGTTD